MTGSLEDTIAKWLCDAGLVASTVEAIGDAVDLAKALRAVSVVPAEPATHNPPEHTVSDRGFIQFDFIDLGEERRVRAYESSAASEAKVWLRLVDDEGMACSQLTLGQARQLADQLVWLTEHHHMAVAAVGGEAPAT